MKIVCSYIMVLVFALVMLKPVMPYISDTVAHVFWYSQHMATVHYENGEYHVHKEAVGDINKDATEKNTGLVKKAFAPTEFIVVSMSLDEPSYFHLNTRFKLSSSSLSNNYLAHFFPPPKA